MEILRTIIGIIVMLAVFILTVKIAKKVVKDLGKGSPQVTIRIPHDLYEICKKAVEDGKYKNMTKLILKGICKELGLDPSYYVF